MKLYSNIAIFFLLLLSNDIFMKNCNIPFLAVNFEPSEYYQCLINIIHEFNSVTNRMNYFWPNDILLGFDCHLSALHILPKQLSKNDWLIDSNSCSMYHFDILLISIPDIVLSMSWSQQVNYDLSRCACYFQDVVTYFRVIVGNLLKSKLIPPQINLLGILKTMISGLLVKDWPLSLTSRLPWFITM